MAVKVWDWTDFKGWLSDHVSMGHAGSFQDGKYVDFLSEPNGIKIGGKFTNLYATDAKTTGFSDAGSSGLSGIASFTQDGKIYDADSGGTLLYTLTGAVASKAIFGIVPRKEWANVYQYVFTEGKIHQANSDFSTVTENYKTFSGQPTSFFSYGTTIYFLAGNYLYSLDDAWALTTEYTFPGGRIPVAMTFFQDTLRVYSNDQVNGFLEVFDISDLSAFSYQTVFDRTPVAGAFNVGSFDYVLAWPSWYNDVYVCSGTQRQLVRASNDWAAGLRSFNGKGDSRLADPYFVSTGGSNNGIYAFTEPHVGINSALNRIFDNSTYDVYAVLCTQSTIYVSYRDSEGVYQVASMLAQYPATYADEGEITSHLTDVWNPFNAKQIAKIELAYDCDATDPQFPHGGAVEIYARKERSDAWTKIADSGVLSGVGCKVFSANGIASSNFGNFLSAEFRLLLKKGTDTSPLVKGVRFTFNETEKNA